jgi:hypothetical protein
MTPRFHRAAAFASGLFFATVSIGGAAAQTDAETLVVTGERLRELTQAYAAEVAVAPASADQYARWNFRLCPSVAGLAPSEAQTLIDHIAVRAHQVGVETERTGCQPNLVFIFAPDANRLAREIVDTRRDLLGYYSEDDVVTAGRDALEDFANTPRPVRWWHVSHTTTADGQQLGNSRTRTGRSTRDAVAAARAANPQDPEAVAGVLGGSGFEGAEGVRSSGTRTRRATRQDLSFALVIIDAPRAAGLPPQAVADYLAMATLVQLDPDADMSAFPSVLNLFDEQSADRPAPTEMTAWDIAYLQGLYRATREAASASRQRADIARRMAERVAAD